MILHYNDDLNNQPSYTSTSTLHTPYPLYENHNLALIQLNTHVALFINTVHELLLIAMIRTDNCDGWGVNVILKDKAPSIYIGYNIAKHKLLTCTFSYSWIHILTTDSYSKGFTHPKVISP